MAKLNIGHTLLTLLYLYFMKVLGLLLRNWNTFLYRIARQDEGY